MSGQLPSGAAPVGGSVAERLLAFARSDGPALLAEDRHVGFGELVGLADRIMGLLAREGWRTGDVVGVAVSDEDLNVAAGLALLCLGAPQVCLPAHETDDSNRRTMDRLGVAMLLRDRAVDFAGGARTIRLSRAIVAGAPSGLGLASHPAADAAAVYVKTSGSTGLPKLFALSFARLDDAAARCAADPAAACVMRLSTVDFDSTRLQRLFGALAGRPTAYAPRDLAGVGDACGRLGVTQVHMGTYALASLMRAGRPPSPFPRETSLMTGGSRVPGPLRADVAARLTPALYVSYATSEIGPISTATPDEHGPFPEGIGRPRPDAIVEIVDEEGSVQPRGVGGEIRVKRPAAPRAYVGETSSQFADGWFYPRDLVSWPQDGPLIYHGRADDVMLLNGVKVSGEAIEDALLEHAAVREAVAFPIRSRVHGEIPAAAVTLRGGPADAPGADALMRHCRERLGMRSPRRIVILDEIPRTAAGKPLRRALAET